jgi:hypothetical protein
MTLCNLAGIKSSPDMIYHVGQAITLVNKRIANRNHKAITKETIFAVACLTNLEVRALSALIFLVLIANNHHIISSDLVVWLVLRFILTA